MEKISVSISVSGEYESRLTELANRWGIGHTSMARVLWAAGLAMRTASHVQDSRCAVMQSGHAFFSVAGMPSIKGGIEIKFVAIAKDFEIATYLTKKQQQKDPRISRADMHRIFLLLGHRFYDAIDVGKTLIMAEMDQQPELLATGPDD